MSPPNAGQACQIGFRMWTDPPSDFYVRCPRFEKNSPINHSKGLSPR